MEFLLVLIIGAFLFAVCGVIGLIGRTKRLGEDLEKIRREIHSVSGKLNDLVRSAAADPRANQAVEAPAQTSPGANPEPRTAPLPPVEAVFADSGPELSAVKPEGPAPLREVPVPKNQAAIPERAGNGLPAGIAAFIHGGNIWAAGGVILLIVAFAMLMTYMARRGFFTLEMRIVAAAISGLVMLVAGWALRKRRPLYFLILQGGGIGILYLTVFAAHKLTAYFPAQAALALISVLIPAALIIAIFQNSQTLAFFGFLGGFAAPILLSGGGSIIFLFVYYAALSLGILAISFFRSWKLTAVLGFAASFGVTLKWITEAYTASDFAYTETFLVLFIVIYTLIGILLLARNAGTNGEKKNLYLELTLIFGTPFLGAAAQWKVFSVIEHGYALVSLLFAIFYIILAFALLRRNARRGKVWKIPPFLVEAYGALALILANLVVPLELSGFLSSAIWAAEGVVVYWMGLRRGNGRVLAAGLVIHAAAALVFLTEGPGAVYGPLRSAAFTGTLVITASALALLALTKKIPRDSAGPPLRYPFLSQTWYTALLVVWSLVWYFAGWGVELRRIFDGYLNLDAFAAWAFIAASGSALLFFALSKLFGIALLNIAAAPSLVIAFFAMIVPLTRRFVRYFFDDFTTIFTYNYLGGLWLWAWIGFAAVHILILILSKKHAASAGCQAAEKVRALWLFVCLLVVLPVLTASLRYLTASINLAASWTALAGIAPLLAALLALSRAFKKIAGAGESFRLFTGTFLPWLLCGAAALWFGVTLFMPGNPSPLPLYIPVLNPLELQEALCAAVIIITQSASRAARLPSMSRPAVFVVADVMGFFWITAMLARTVHFFAGIPFGGVGDSDAFNLALFIFWAFWGIGHIVLGHRLSLRPVWIAGAILTTADIAKLLLLDLAGIGTPARIASFFIAGLALLFIGWAAPLPPSLKKDGA
jgi:uncharacterized membrane protein